MRVKFKHKFSLNGKTFEKNQEAELEERVAKALLKRGVVEEVKKKVGGKR